MGGRSVRRRRAWMSRHDVPQQYAILEPELCEHSVDDRCTRLRGPRARELALGGERDAGDTRSAVARCFADEKNRRACLRTEVTGEPRAEQRGPRAYGVLVERRAHPRPREIRDECLRG